MAPLLRGWSDDVVLLTHGAPLDDDVRSALVTQGIPVYEEAVASLRGAEMELAEIVLEGGTVLGRAGLFVAPDQKQVPLIDGMGLETTDDGYVRVDSVGATSQPMMWAAGDLTSRLQQVVEAAAQGARAAVMIHASLTLS